jgi:hypothetical protein
MRMLVTEKERAWQASGRTMYGPTEPERESLIYPV